MTRNHKTAEMARALRNVGVDCSQFEMGLTWARTNGRQWRRMFRSVFGVSVGAAKRRDGLSR